MAKRNTDIGGDLNIVKQKIKYYRLKNHYSCPKLSNMLMLYGIDINKQELYKIEKGIRTVVDYELCGFAKVFNIPLEELVSDYMNKL